MYRVAMTNKRCQTPSRSRYVSHVCRCSGCREANTEYERKRSAAGLAASRCQVCGARLRKDVCGLCKRIAEYKERFGEEAVKLAVAAAAHRAASDKPKRRIVRKRTD